MNNDEHLTEGIGKIVSIKASMNKGINISVFKNFFFPPPPAAKPRSREAKQPSYLGPPSCFRGGVLSFAAGGGVGIKI